MIITIPDTNGEFEVSFNVVERRSKARAFNHELQRRMIGLLASLFLLEYRPSMILERKTSGKFFATRICIEQRSGIGGAPAPVDASGVLVFRKNVLLADAFICAGVVKHARRDSHDISILRVG